MNSLREYFNKQVKITDTDGKQFNGFVETYTPAIDSDEGLEEISINHDGSLIGFNENEIKSIEVV